MSAPSDVQEAQLELLNPVSQVYFRAGLIACREYMARFVEAQDPSTAMSIRANWWPQLGKDYGPPRLIAFDELTSGEFGTPEFRTLTREEVSPTLEALPVALGFLDTRLMAAKAGPTTPAPSSIEQLAAAQGVGPIYDLSVLAGGLPDDFEIPERTPAPSSEGPKLERYGVLHPADWRSHAPMPDGYWTPWYIAQDALTAAAQREQILRQRFTEEEAAHRLAHQQWLESRATLSAQARQIEAVRAALQKWANRADHGFDPEESDASVEFWRGVRRVTEEALAAVPENPS